MRACVHCNRVSEYCCTDCVIDTRFIVGVCPECQAVHGRQCRPNATWARRIGQNEPWKDKPAPARGATVLRFVREGAGVVEAAKGDAALEAFKERLSLSADEAPPEGEFRVRFLPDGFPPVAVFPFHDANTRAIAEAASRKFMETQGDPALMAHWARWTVASGPKGFDGPVGAAGTDQLGIGVDIRGPQGSAAQALPTVNEIDLLMIEYGSSCVAATVTKAKSWEEDVPVAHEAVLSALDKLHAAAARHDGLSAAERNGIVERCARVADEEHERRLDAAVGAKRAGDCCGPVNACATAAAIRSLRSRPAEDDDGARDADALIAAVEVLVDAVVVRERNEPARPLAAAVYDARDAIRGMAASLAARAGVQKAGAPWTPWAK